MISLAKDCPELTLHFAYNENSTVKVPLDRIHGVTGITRIYLNDPEGPAAPISHVNVIESVEHVLSLMKSAGTV